MTPDILTIQEAMSRVMGDVREVKKDSINKQQNFPFRGIDAVVNAVGPALRTHGVVVLPKLESIEYLPYKTTKGTGMMSCRVIVTYGFYGPGMDPLFCTVAGEASDSGDKATAKAMSVAFRIALLQALALPTDDIDPDASSHERSAPSAAPSGESTVEPNGGQGTVTSPAHGEDAQAGIGGGMSPSSASPSMSTAGGLAVEGVPAGDTGDRSGGSAAPTTPAGTPTKLDDYLDADDQANLIDRYGGKVKAINAYKAKYGERIGRIGDITYAMVAEVENA